jgi:predicted CXXCH cytochrome family protein
MLVMSAASLLATAASLASVVSPPTERSTSKKDHPPVTAMTGAACTSCHGDILARRVMHGPAASGDCAACHIVASTTGSGGVRRIGLKGNASARDTAALCVACHTDTADRLKQPHRHAPVASGNCSACHDPHGSAYRFQLPADGNQTCTKCHEDIAQALAQSHVHGPAVNACVICHDAHAATQPAQLKAAGNSMCIACHVDAAADRAASDPHALFGPARIDGLDALIAKAPRILLDESNTTGHPTRGHPVDARTDPAERGRSLRCASCHNPHGSVGAKLLRFGATGVSSLCIRCHSF